MLELSDVSAGYGSGTVLEGVTLQARAAEIVGILGRNGAGKTTTLKTVLGLTRVISGSIRCEHRELVRMPPHEIPRLGIAYVPQGRRVFPDLSVRENLFLARTRKPIDTERLERVLAAFPPLRGRLVQRAGTLSGGEQQMLAFARALLMDPQWVLLDEPTEGLMPSLVRTVERHISEMKAEGLGVLLAEQRLDVAFSLCDRLYVMDRGRIVWRGPPAEGDRERLKRYIGI